MDVKKMKMKELQRAFEEYAVAIIEMNAALEKAKRALYDFDIAAAKAKTHISLQAEKITDDYIKRSNALIDKTVRECEEMK